MRCDVHRIKCKFCPEKLTNENMHHHIKVFHKNVLNSKENLKRQNTKIHRITNKKFECPFCSTIFSSHQERANHKKLKH